jgi:peptide/nickel transport system substrate-binding protein
MTFYLGATGAAWIVPKKYVEKVGDEGFKKAPVGAGPYKFASFTPGVELVLGSFDQYWPAATATSTAFSWSRRASSTRSGGRRHCTASSSSSKRRWSRRSG